MTIHQSPVTNHQSRLSVVLATRNEEENIGRCLESVSQLADEIVIVDEFSTDKTTQIAKTFGAKVFEVKHEPIFHKTKQKALERATCDWILQLDADEKVTQELAKEIKETINLRNEELKNLRTEKLKNRLFGRHQKLIEQRDGPIGKKSGEIVGFFIPRVNYFLGKPLIHAGVYPDPSIRLVKKGMAHFSGESVHDIMQIDGEVSWLENAIEHHDSPTLRKYFYRLNRYTDIKAQELQNTKTPKNVVSFIKFTLLLSTYYFLLLYFRHKGFLDGVRGFLWSFFSAMHYPIGYFKYVTRYT